MFQVLNISISHHQSFWYAHPFIFSYRFATKTALRIMGVTESIPAVLRQRLFYTVEEFTSLSRGHVESKQRHRENMKTPHRKRAAVIDHWGIQPPKYNYNYNWWCRVPSRKWPGRGTKPTTLQSQGRRFITKPLSGNNGDLTNDFSSLVSELVAGAEDWKTLTPPDPSVPAETAAPWAWRRRSLTPSPSGPLGRSASLLWASAWRPASGWPPSSRFSSASPCPTPSSGGSRSRSKPRSSTISLNASW